MLVSFLDVIEYPHSNSESEQLTQTYTNEILKNVGMVERIHKK